MRRSRHSLCPLRAAGGRSVRTRRDSFAVGVPKLCGVEYQWRSLKGEPIATAPSQPEARQRALMKMLSMGVGTAKLYYRASPDQPWQESDSDLLEHPKFDSDFPRS